MLKWTETTMNISVLILVALQWTNKKFVHENLLWYTKRYSYIQQEQLGISQTVFAPL